MNNSGKQLNSEKQFSEINFRLGLAVWAFKDWVGDFYPPKTQATNFLQRYGERMLAVEGNTTFYSVPSAEMVTRWVEKTPSAFRFCPKLPRAITHDVANGGALMPHLSEALSFCKLMQGLGVRLGPIMVQLPPSYSPLRMSDLTSFLSAWPRQEVPIAVEVRHIDWFKPQSAIALNNMLRQLGVGRVLLDTRAMYDYENEGDADPQLYSNRRKPKVSLQPTVTADFTIVRYISHPRLLRNEDYLKGWAKQVNQWLSEGTQVYFFVHCPREEESPAIARHFQKDLEETSEAFGVQVPPLPWNELAQPPDQLALF